MVERWKIGGGDRGAAGPLDLSAHEIDGKDAQVELVVHRGGCHCGRVRFEVDAPAEIVVDECNCSICRMTGFLHLIVPAGDFRLVEGEDELVEYRFGTETARHLFCRHCGIKPFYVPRSHPDGWSVNLRCIEEESIKTVEVRSFDGKHWEQNVEALRSATPATPAPPSPLDPK